MDGGKDPGRGMLTPGEGLSLSVFGHVPACERLLDKVTFKAPIQLSPTHSPGSDLQIEYHQVKTSERSAMTFCSSFFFFLNPH